MLILIDQLLLKLSGLQQHKSLILNLVILAKQEE